MMIYKLMLAVIGSFMQYSMQHIHRKQMTLLVQSTVSSMYRCGCSSERQGPDVSAFTA
jgi:hypothetical protein